MVLTSGRQAARTGYERNPRHWRRLKQQQNRRLRPGTIPRACPPGDDGVNTFGFNGHPAILLEWMIENGFPLRNVNLALYD
jgi:hypothetical protein